MYIHDAVATVAANIFSSKGGTKKTYPAEPYDIFGEEETEAQKEKKEEQERLKAKLYMQNMVRAGRSWGK
jgi:hypothetical protein